MRSGSFQWHPGMGGAESWVLEKVADPGTGAWAPGLPSSLSHHPGLLFSDRERKAGLPVGTVPVPGGQPPLPTLNGVLGPGLKG